MKITLVRHGEVQEEYIGKYNGHNDIGLSRRGKEQMHSLAQALQDEDYDAVFSSDLRRAHESIEHFIFDEVTYTKALREKSWGEYEGLGFEEITSQGLIYENFLQWIKALGGEPISTYQERVNRFFQELCSCEYENVFVMTHAGVIRTLMGEYQGLTLEESFALKLPYGSVVVFDTKEQCFSTVKYKIS